MNTAENDPMNEWFIACLVTRAEAHKANYRRRQTDRTRVWSGEWGRR